MYPDGAGRNGYRIVKCFARCLVLRRLHQADAKRSRLFAFRRFVVFAACVMYGPALQAPFRIALSLDESFVKFTKRQVYLGSRTALVA